MSLGFFAKFIAGGAINEQKKTRSAEKVPECERNQLKTQVKTSRGFARPYGATPSPEGVNFSLFSKHADHVSLCLFHPGETSPFVEIPLDPQTNRTGSVWHLFVHNLPLQSLYGYRVSGPYEPEIGHLFDNRVVLLDPYAKQSASTSGWGQSNPFDGNNYFPGALSPPSHFNWEGDTFPRLPLRDLIIYEMHVRGFTQDPSSGAREKGKFLGIIEKIPYLKSLGVNAVELLPIYEFNELDNNRINPETEERLWNYWGYSTINFFSPMNRYGTSPESTLNEFRTLVKEFHANGIEVILDVVYNHTAEGNQEGPTLSFKGLENSVYYMLGPNGSFLNFSGCGNTFNCNNPIVRKLILDSLRYWVVETHVDGFRFDLASILTRSADGIPLAVPPLVEAITQDPILADTKLIAEAWDAGGLYQVGSFPAFGRWAEWNGKYRDDVRSFIKGTDGNSGIFATRISGSEDLYGEGRQPYHSINYVSCHDGFTLADLVAYNEKHNHSNGENNQDGDNNNLSWNCGVEGESQDPAILTLRERQRKNFHVAVMISHGVPMIQMGDEYGHTKKGNNNTWSHDSRINWFQWDTLEQNQPFFRFYQMMIALRKEHPILSRSRFPGSKDVTWHGIEPGRANWSGDNRFIACSLPDHLNGYTLYIAFNAYHEETTAHLPWRDHPWHRLVYTFLPSPEDILPCDQAVQITGKTFTLAPYSALILKSRN